MKKGKEESKKKEETKKTTKKTNETKKKKSNFDKSTYFMILLVLLIVLLLLLVFNRHETSTFRIEDRLKEIGESQKKDTNTVKTVGWIRVEGTNIDHPVLAAREGIYNQDIKQPTYSWMNTKKAGYTNNMTVVGHNYLNVSAHPKKTSKDYERFESLMAFVYPDFAEENQFIQLTYNNKNYLYQIFAVSFMFSSDFFTLPLEQVDKETQQEFIDFVNSRTIYKYNVKVDSSDNILNVSTCTRMFGDSGRTNFVVSAKLVPNNKRTKNKITKTDLYDEVDKKMMGGEENEIEEG